MTKPAPIAALDNLYYRYHQACLALHNANSPYPCYDSLREEYLRIGVDEFNRMIKEIEQAKQFFEKQLTELTQV